MGGAFFAFLFEFIELFAGESTTVYRVVELGIVSECFHYFIHHGVFIVDIILDPFAFWETEKDITSSYEWFYKNLVVFGEHLD